MGYSRRLPSVERSRRRWLGANGDNLGVAGWRFAHVRKTPRVRAALAACWMSCLLSVRQLQRSAPWSWSWSRSTRIATVRQP